MALFLIMYKIIFLICFFVISCSTSNTNLKSQSCQNNGTIDFLYINIPCESCIQFIEELIEDNDGIFDYNIIGNKNEHILINYCYNDNLVSKLDIEEMFRSNGFILDREINEQQLLSLKALCCIEE